MRRGEPQADKVRDWLRILRKEGYKVTDTSLWYSPNLEGNLPPNPESDEWWMVPAGGHCPLLEELEDTATSLAVAEHYVEVAVTQEAFEHLKHLLEVMSLVTTTGNPAPKLWIMKAH